MSDEQRWYGLWIPAHKVWEIDSTGRIIHYPSRAIAEAHITTMVYGDEREVLVREFGDHER